MSRLEESIATPPPHARVVVEGGHHTLRRLQWKSSVLTGPRTYYFQVDIDAPVLPFQKQREQVEKEIARQWAVLKIPEGEEVRVPEGVTRGIINTFEAPTASEIRSLERAIATAKELRSKVEHVELALMLGDLYVPPELRGEIDWALPAEYARAIERADGIPLVLLSESKCQNQGTKVIERAKRHLRHRDALKNLYQRAGCTILIDTDSDRALYLAADGLIDNQWTEYPIIALTKGESRPACAATIAGKLHLLRDRKLTHHIAWYDMADDDKIRQKNVEGFIIAACFFLDMELDTQIVTTDGDRSPQIDHLVMSDLRQRGRRAGYDVLEEAAEREARDIGMAFIGASAPGECCVYPKTQR